MAVAAPPSSSALDVFSVIAAPDVPPDRVDAAAHQVAAMLAGDEGSARRVPVEELADGTRGRSPSAASSGPARPSKRSGRPTFPRGRRRATTT